MRRKKKLPLTHSSASQVTNTLLPLLVVTTLERWPWLPWALQKSASLGQAMFTIVWVGAVITRKGSSPRQVQAQPTFKKAQQGEWGGGY